MTSNDKPDIVVFDFAFWVAALARQLGIKSVVFVVISAATLAHNIVPARKIDESSTVETLREPPPGCPCLKIPLEVVKGAPQLAKEFGSGISFYDRCCTGMTQCDALGIRTCREVEGRFCDYLSEQYGKPVLLSGPLLPETGAGFLEERWVEWLSNFKPHSVVYCALGSQVTLVKDQFQELLLGLELAGSPFLAALRPPEGCSTVDEALPKGFKERISGRGAVEAGWVQQPLMLKHPAVGCFVSHCGFGSMWEGLLSDCQMVATPFLGEQIINGTLLANELKVAVEVERDDDKFWWTKEGICREVKAVMEEGSEVGRATRNNHANLRKVISGKDWQRSYADRFVQHLEDICACRLE